MILIAIHFADKINIFENSIENTRIDGLSLKDTMKQEKNQDFSSPSSAGTSQETLKKLSPPEEETFPIVLKPIHEHFDNDTKNSEDAYKSDIVKNSFIKTQLLDETVTHNDTGIQAYTGIGNTDINEMSDHIAKSDLAQQCNVTDDNRLANSGHAVTPSLQTDESTISIPPRRKKKPSMDTKTNSDNTRNMNQSKLGLEFYPDHLNPFSEDEEEVLYR